MSRHLLSVARNRETIVDRDREAVSPPRVIRIAETDPLDVPEINVVLPDGPPQRRREREVSRVLSILDGIQREGCGE